MRTEKEILQCVQRHHDNVVEHIKNRNAEVLMTVLVGSQNYNLASETSDIDTYSFILPSFSDISCAASMFSTEYEVEDGKCCIKDMREALNLLIKTNPNSIEWFCSDYIVYNKNYENILKKYLSPDKRKSFLYCDISRMGTSCAGMSNQLKNRNMPAGKKYSHALRIKDMWQNYIAGNTDGILKFIDEDTRLCAAKAKRCTDPDKEIEFQENSALISDEIYQDVRKDCLTEPGLQENNIKYVRQLQFLLMAKHIFLSGVFE